MTYLHRGRNGNVDKCHTYNVDETETLTNVILTMERNGNVDKWLEQKRRQMSTYNVDETETLTNVILNNVDETETSTNDILTQGTKRKRRQMDT